MAEEKARFDLVDDSFFEAEEMEGFNKIILSQEELQDILGGDIEQNYEEIERNQQEMEENLVEVRQTEADALQDYVRGQRNENTNKKTRQVHSRFVEWLVEQNEDQQILDMQPEYLNVKIGLFLMSLTKKDGSDMEPDSITSFHRAIDRYLRENNYGESIITSEKFRSSRDVLHAKRRNLKSLGLGNKPNRAEAMSNTMVEKLWSEGQLGSATAKSLQNTIFYFLTQGFGFRGSHESRQLQWGDVQLMTDENGREYLTFNEKLSKTRTGDAASGARAFSPKIFSTGGDRCPVEMFKLYKSHRPESMLEANSPFYLCVKTKLNPAQTVWYASIPMGKNSIAKIVPNMAKSCSIPGKITNHSLRKNTCQNLIASGVPPVLVAQLTGHKNVNSLSSYTTANIDQQRAMSDIITGASTNENVIPTIAYPARALPISLPVALPGPSASASSSAGSPSTAVVRQKQMVPAVENILQATNGMFSSAQIHGNVNLNINYNVHAMSSQLNVSPKAAIN